MNEHARTDIYEMIVRFIDECKPFALAVVLHAKGSTPGKPGGKAVIEPDGRIHGTVGGGTVEATAQQYAIEACRSKKPRVFDFAFAGADASSDMPVCGGAMRVLVDPNAALNRSVWAAAAQGLQNRQRGVLLTRITTTADLQVQTDWVGEGIRPADPLAEQIDACIKNEQAVRIVDKAAGTEILIDPLIAHPMLVILGGGHVGQALAIQAQLVGFDVIIIDDRVEFADPGRFPAGTRTLCGDTPDVLNGLQIGRETYVVIVTRGHRHDAEALRACIDSPAAYIGMIGSTRKIAVLRADFIASGVPADRFDRVFAPIGIDIGAVTVPEIATSIVAQLVAVRRKGRDAADRIRVGP